MLDDAHRLAYIELYPLAEDRTLLLTEGHLRVEAQSGLDDVAARLVTTPPNRLSVSVEDAIKQAPVPHSASVPGYVVVGSGRLADALAGVDNVPLSWRDVLESLDPCATYVVPEVAWRSADAPSMDDWTSKVHWLPARIFKGVIEVGPLLGVGTQCRYDDLLGRRRAAAYSSMHDQALGEPTKVLNDYPTDHYHRAFTVLRRALPPDEIALVLSGHKRSGTSSLEDAQEDCACGPAQPFGPSVGDSPCERSSTANRTSP